MKFKTLGILTLDGRGVLVELSKQQADRRRAVIRRVMPDGSRASVLPQLMRPAPELPELGTYALAGATHFKAGEVLGFPGDFNVVGSLGKGAADLLEPVDEAAKASMESAEKKAKAEKKPLPPHGGPATFKVAPDAAPIKPAKDDKPTSDKPAVASKAAPGNVHSISKGKPGR